MNLYGFGGGDPVNHSDPFGLCPIPKPGENCIQEGINWAYQKTGSETVLNVLAGVDAILTGIGETTSIESGGIGGPVGAGGGLLFRFGKAATVEGLAADALKAERAGGEFGHGVSVSLRKPRGDFLQAERSAVEEAFPVRQTGNNPAHHTVELPKPVTKEVVDRFNNIFRPKE